MSGHFKETVLYFKVTMFLKHNTCLSYYFFIAAILHLDTLVCDLPFLVIINQVTGDIMM